MSKDYTDLELARMCEGLKDAFETAVQQDAKMIGKIMAAQEENAELLSEVQSLTANFLAKAMAEMLSTPQNKLEEKLAPDALVVVDKTFEFGIATVGEDTIRKYVTPATQTEDISAAFKNRGMVTLAKLFAPK